MEIHFGSLKEIKEFIMMVDVYHLCDKQEEWGGKGYIIKDRYFDSDEKENMIVTRPEESKVIHAGGDQIIITPYYKQLSWLFKTLHDYVIYGDQLSAGTFLSGFHIGCEGCFIMNPDHSAKELMIFVLDGLQRMVDAGRERECSDEK